MAAKFKTIQAIMLFGAVVTCVCIFAVYNKSSSVSSLLWLTSDSLWLHQTTYFHSRDIISQIPTFQVKSKSIKPIWELPPPGSKMPDLESFRLTMELVQERVKDNVIVVTFGNYAYMDFILTWVKHLTDLGVHNLVVGALDTQVLKALYRKGVPVFDMGAHMTTIDVGWGSPAFHKMGRQKAIFIDAVLPFGFEVLMCDADMVWLKNPLPYLARFPEADILTSTDSFVSNSADDSLDSWEQVPKWTDHHTFTNTYNVGIFHWRPTNSSKKLAKEWKEKLLANGKIWDQLGFNDIVQRKVGPSVDEYSRLFYAYDGELKVGILPSSIFCSGHTYFVQAMYQQLGLEPYAAHTTFQNCATQGKRHRLREGMLFFDPPTYYDSPGGFLTFKTSIPKSLLYEGEHNIESHFALVNYQIKKIRDAFAVASVLNRTLVMPPLWCRLDRLWFAHPGILKGSMTKQPFLCPMDHVFRIDVMTMNLPVDKFGPQIGFREYSLFENPSMSEKVKESWLDVRLCDEGSEGCHVSTTSSNGSLKFPKHGNEEVYKSVFSAFKDIKVIQFLSMEDAFSGFSDEAKEQKFRNRMKHYISSWCCTRRTPQGGGYIPFDIYWDEME